MWPILLPLSLVVPHTLVLWVEYDRPSLNPFYFSEKFFTSCINLESDDLSRAQKMLYFYLAEGELA